MIETYKKKMHMHLLSYFMASMFLSELNINKHHKIIPFLVLNFESLYFSITMSTWQIFLTTSQFRHEKLKVCQLTLQGTFPV